MSENSSQPTIIDPAHDLRTVEPNPLDYIFFPKTVAVIGASEKEGSVGRTVLWNLISNPFGGTVFPINPNRSHVMGVHAYPSVKDVPGDLDLVVICTAAKAVPALVKESVERGVKGIIVISAGFKEMGKEGEALEQQILEHTRGTNIRIIGPNCLGVMNPLSGLNATFGKGMARPGNVAFISQSGALCTAILDWSISAQVGFSAFVSIGSMIDVNWGDLIDYLGNDPRTHSIVIYMESVGNARAFMNAAREVALTKPIIVIKAGRTAAAAKAAASHTGSLTGSDDVLDVAFKRVGVMRVNQISDLFAMAETLSKQPLPQGPRLTIVTNAGGPGVLATDHLVMGGGQLSEINSETFQALNDLLPPHWSRNNPIDILGDAEPSKYAKALEISSKDPNADGMLVILTPQDMTNPTQTAEALTPYAKSLGKPVLASWMGGAGVQAGREILNRAGIPEFEHPDDACKAFNYLWQYHRNLREIYETPLLGDNLAELVSSGAKAEEILNAVRADGRNLLNEYESKKLLAAYGIRTVRTEVAATADEAVAHAKELGYPVVVKLHSNTITHKTDVGGVKLNLKSDDDVRRAFEEIRRAVTEKHSAADFLGVTVQEMVKMDGYELILGSSIDPQFGPVLLFGAGGTLVEVFKDRALALPPLTASQARRTMGRTKIYAALKGVRGRKSVDLDALDMLLVRFSRLISQEPWIAELDINPLVVSPDHMVALDARVLLHDPKTPEAELPRAAIRPYPLKYITQAKMRDGQGFTIRPIRPEDVSQLVAFHQRLSERSMVNRYGQNVLLDERTAQSRMTRTCFSDYDMELNLVACHCRCASPETGQCLNEDIIGICRLRRHQQDRSQAEFALIVGDEWHGRGIGTELMKATTSAAKSEGITKLGAYVLASNKDGLELCQALGFQPVPAEAADKVRLELKL